MITFEEYKFFAEATNILNHRRQAASQLYLTSNITVSAGLAVLFKGTDFHGWTLVLASFPLFLVGIFLCLIWYKIIIQYKSLIGWRYDQLMEMERTIPESYKMYIKEWDTFFKPKRKKEKFGFSRLEMAMPKLFMILYVLYGTGLLFYVLMG